MAYPRTFLNHLLIAAILLLPNLAAADPRGQGLQSCLDEFEGIEWKLPYRPPIDIYRCTSRKESADGHPALELIGDLTLGRDSNLSSDENYAALQAAVFVHFDTLFRRNGYRRAAAENDGNARTTYYPNTMRMLHAEPPLPEKDARAQDLPPIPFVNYARYERLFPGYYSTLTYKTGAKNTWLITVTLETAQGAPNTPAGAAQ